MSEAPSFDLGKLSQESEGADEVFHALAARPRRDLVLLLSQGEASVGELAENFDISRPAISKHLLVLRQAGLVSCEKVGRQNIYQLEHEPLEEVLEWLVEIDRFWVQHLQNVGERLDAGNVDGEN